MNDLNTEFIKQNLGPMTARDISRRLDISIWEIHKVGKELGIKYRYSQPRVSWTNDMDKIIAAHYPTKSSTEVGNMLGLDRRIVYRRAMFLGIRRNNAPTLTRWTTSMDRKIMELYPTANNKRLAFSMGITVRSLTARASRLKVKKAVK